MENNTPEYVKKIEQSTPTRVKNFSDKEKYLLCDLVSQHAEIEDKRTDAVTSRMKLRAWEDIAEKFNSSNPINRSVQSLCTLWKNMKTRTKKNNCERRRQIRKTGGGTCEPNSNEKLDARVEAIISHKVQELHNPFDDDDDDDVAEGESQNNLGNIIIEDSHKETDVTPENVVVLTFEKPSEMEHCKSASCENNCKKRKIDDVKRTLLETDVEIKMKEHILKMEMMKEEMEMRRKEHKMRMRLYEKQLQDGVFEL